MAQTRRTKEDWELAVKQAYREGVQDGIKSILRERSGNVVDNVASTPATPETPKAKESRKSIGTENYTFGTNGSSRYLNVAWAHLSKLTPEVVAQLNLKPTRFDHVDGAKGFQIIGDSTNASVETALCEVLGL